MSVAGKVSSVLDRHLSRRSFLVRSAFVGSALAAGGSDFVLQPGTAYAAICGPSTCGGYCDCSSTCCIGYTEFCCVLDGGYNSCPQGTIMGGWWLAEGSEYCSGARYYMDCNGVCECSDECGTFCSGCDGLRCECAGGSCANYRTGCFAFRYGQCNQDVSCVGRIKCRVVTCVPPWEIDACTRTQATDDGPANQNAPCLKPGPTYPPPPCDSPATACEVVSIAMSRKGTGYGIATASGRVLGYGNWGSTDSPAHEKPVVALVAGPERGNWLLTSAGRVICLDGAPFHGDARALRPETPFVAMASTPTGDGYWLVTEGGRVLPYGNAGYHGDPVKVKLEYGFVGMAATPTGKGYWLASGAGKVFHYGDATYEGEPYHLNLQDRFVAIHARDDGQGYWLVNTGGHVLAYGDARAFGGTQNDKLPYPIVAMIPTRVGKGYYLVAKDGRVYPFGEAAFYGDPFQKGT